MIKNIVFFIQNFSRSAGSERVVSIIANSLAEKDYNVSILSICGDNKSFYPISKNIKLYTLIDKPEIDNKKNFLKVLSRLKQFYKRHKTDLVIDVFAALSIYTILLKNKFKYKNITWEHFNFNAKVGLNPLGRKLASKKSNLIITLTEQDREYYLNGLKNIKADIKSIGNPSPYGVQNVSTERDNILIAVGRLTYQKGYDNLIEIWNLIDHKGFKLYIIGNGEEKEKLLSKIEILQVKDISILPATTSIDKYYRMAKIFVSSSRFEGFPMTMIEAQSFGIPIISYDYDTGPRDIIVDGYNGYLVENNNKNDFVEKLQKLLCNEELVSELSNNSIENSKKYDVQPIVDKWLELIKKIEE